MNEPLYLRPTNLNAAFEELERWGERAHLLAGGTDLLIAMRRGLARPEAVIDISLLGELRGFCLQDGYVYIGALTTHSELRHSQDLMAWAPLLSQACRQVGSVQIRNLGTLGGNLGNASPAGDTFPALYVLAAEVHLISLGGERWVPVEAFFTGPGKTVRRTNEIIAGVRFRLLAEDWRSFFLKLGQRRALTVSKVSAAGALQLEGERVLACRLALGSVAPTAIRLPEAEAQLVGGLLTAETIRIAAQTAAESCLPITDIRSTVDYRRAMSGVLIRRGLESNLTHEVTNG